MSHQTTRSSCSFAETEGDLDVRGEPQQRRDLLEGRRGRVERGEEEETAAAAFGGWIRELQVSEHSRTDAMHSVRMHRRPALSHYFVSPVPVRVVLLPLSLFSVLARIGMRPESKWAMVCFKCNKRTIDCVGIYDVLYLLS